MDGSILQHLDGTTCQNWPDLFNENWNAAHTKHILRCMNPEHENSGLCVITIEGENITWGLLDPDAQGEYLTSPDGLNFIYKKSESDQECIYIAEFKTLQPRQLFCQDDVKNHSFSDFEWLSESQRFIALYEDWWYREESVVKLFDSQTGEYKDLFTYTGAHENLVYTSPDRSQVVFCAGQPKSEVIKFFYFYDFNTSKMLKIEDTSMINNGENICYSGSFSWNDSYSVFFTTWGENSQSYKLDFENGKIVE